MVEEIPAGSRVDRALTVMGKARRDDQRLEPETLRKYGRGMTGFEDWCRDHRRHSNPPTPETLAVYAEALLQAGYAKRTIEGRLAAIKAVLRGRGVPLPDGVPAWSVLRGADPTLGDHSDGGSDTPVVGEDELGRLAVAAYDDGRFAGLRDRWLVLAVWVLSAGETELARLDLGDVREVDVGLVVQVGKRAVYVQHDHRGGFPCPVEAFTFYRDRLAGRGAVDGPMFRSIDKAGNVGGCGPKAGKGTTGGRMSTRGISKAWAAAVRRAGLPVWLTPWVMKWGAAVAAVREGVPVTEVLLKGGWSPRSWEVAQRLTAAAAAGTGESDG